MITFLSSLIFTLILSFVGYVFLRGAAHNPGRWKTLHRDKKIGIVLAFICLAWSAYHGMQLLEDPQSTLRRLLPILVVVISVGVYFLIDYIFTRAFGGLLLLTTNFLLYAAWSDAIVLRPVFSLVCYIFAIAGMFMVGQPWRFRDLLFKAIDNPPFGRKVALTIWSLCSVLLILPLISYAF